MYAADYRAVARRALTGRWPLAVLAGLVAALLGGGSDLLDFNVNVDLSHGYTNAHLQLGPLKLAITPTMLGWLSSVAIVSLVVGFALYVLGSVIQLGYARFNLELVGGGGARLDALFSYFSWFGTAFCARFLTSLYTFLWSLLFVIPGIVAGFSYAMVPYILAETPEMTASDAIAASKQMMRGNRWALFCLEFSFIGWSILCLFTLGIGNLFLNPYREAAKAAFYLDLRGCSARPADL